MKEISNGLGMLNVKRYTKVRSELAKYRTDPSWTSGSIFKRESECYGYH